MIKRFALAVLLLFVANSLYAYGVTESTRIPMRVVGDSTYISDVVQDREETEPPISTLIFEENFDAQPDWATAGRNALPPNLPVNWDFARTDEQWHPADGDIGTQPSMMIHGNNPEQVYGGTGKAFITYSESFNDVGNNGFGSDGILWKDLPPTDEIFVRFKLKFQPGWATTLAEAGQIKIFRVSSWDGPNTGRGERTRFGTVGNNAPLYFFDWSHGIYGARHFHAFRCDAQTTNYFCTAPVIADAPRQILSGDMSANFSSNIAIHGSRLPDLVNGGLLSTDPQAIISHNQVYGDVWHTIELHLKLNSQPGVQDGVFRQWLDGQKMVDMVRIAWIGTSGDINAKWNSIALGGNDLFHFDLTGAPADRERWYAIDDVEVYNALPPERQ